MARRSASSGSEVGQSDTHQPNSTVVTTVPMAPNRMTKMARLGHLRRRRLVEQDRLQRRHASTSGKIDEPSADTSGYL
jgi:hypothetical protein